MSEDKTKKDDTPVEKEEEATPAEAPATTEAPKEEVAEEAPAEETAEVPADEEVAEEAVAEEATEEAPAVEVVADMPYKAKLENFDRIQPGQTVRLHERIKDVSPKGEVRERIQVFEGLILQMGGSGISRTVTLQKSSGGIMVEKIYPINSPVVAKIELVKSAKVRRAKLNYLKNPKRRFKRKLREVHTDLGKQKKKKKGRR
jgi:large subunit ribosomal protein L19